VHNSAFFFYIVNRNAWKVGFMVMLPLWFGQYKAKVRAANTSSGSGEA
jgi:hypothetical protein